MSNQRFVVLSISLFMVFTQGLWERLFFLTPGSPFLVELPIWIYLILSFKTITGYTPVRSLIIALILYSLFSSFGNNSSLIEWAKYFRFFLYFYLIYASLWNTPLTRYQWQKILKLAIFLIIIQGLGSAFNVFILDQRVEGHVGLMSSLGGTKASTFPLFIISLVTLLLYFLNNPSRRLVLILFLMIVSVGLVGYASSKRAIYFTVPLFIVLATLLSFSKLKSYLFFYKKVSTLLFLTILFLPIYFFGVVNSKGLNYNLKGDESNTEIIEVAINYAQTYENTTSQSGATSGRSGTSAQIIEKSLNSLDKSLLGYGYTSYKEESTRYELGFNYGIVGFTRDILAGGWILMLLTVLIMSKMILKNESLKYSFTRTVRLMILAVFLFTHFSYSADFMVHLKIDFLLALILVFINSPSNHQTLEATMNTYIHK